MAGNPKDSEWFSTPRTLRRRKGVELTLSDKARARLKKLSEARDVPQSQVVEDLVMAAPIRKPP